MQNIHLRTSSKVLRRARLLGLAGLGVTMAACASSPMNIPENPANFGAPDPVAVVPVGTKKLGPNDKIRVTVFRQDTLSGEFQIEETGQFDFPLIGAVQAQGRTAPELAQHIAERLRERHLRQPNVQVSLVEAAEQTITVDGSVVQPGVMPIKGTTTLIRAVAMGRGTSEDADPGKVVVFRQVNGQRMAAAFDLRAIRRGDADDPTIYPDDVVVVHGSRARTLFKGLTSVVPVLGIFRPF